MKALVTGIGGFAGIHLLDLLLAKGVEVGGVVFHPQHGKAIANRLANVSIFAGDLNDPKFVNRVIRDFGPDQVYHLAAQSSAAVSFQNPEQTLIGNINSQLNILEAVRSYELDPKILIVGSAEEYGLIYKNELPINEAAPLRPIQPYAVSKITQDYLGYQYYLAYKMGVVRVRPFNFIGPYQRTDFVVADFSNQVAQIMKGTREAVVKVGNIEAKRDFTDVRDMVQAFYLAVEKGEAGEVYNLGSGKSYSVRWILEKLIELSGKDIKIEVEQKRLRPVDIPETICDNSKFVKQTGWSTQIDIEKTLADTLNYYVSINE